MKTDIAQHTPGPWTLRDHPDKPCELLVRGFTHQADIYMTDYPEANANAHLIAAAPELLEALENLTRHVAWAISAQEIDLTAKPGIVEANLIALDAIRKARSL